MYPKVKAFALSAIGLNHNPLLLSFTAPPEKRPKLFRFEDFWPKNEECERILREMWSSPPWCVMSLTLKLKRTTYSLAK